MDEIASPFECPRYWVQGTTYNLPKIVMYLGGSGWVKDPKFCRYQNKGLERGRGHRRCNLLEMEPRGYLLNSGNVGKS